MNWHSTKPLEVVDRASVPVLETDSWVVAIREKLAEGASPVALFGEKESAGGFRVWCILGDASENHLFLTTARMPERGGRFASLARDFPAMSGFECELFEQTGIVPEGHPWLRPVRAGGAWRGKDGAPYAFYRVEGDEVHEVAVGPVHAGVIEPGHFRFQCHGEQILHLEIGLGYQHRGVEALLPRRNAVQRLILVESIAGDSVIAHATAFCAGLESLAGISLSLREHAVRGIAAELERIAMHLASLGGIATDIGFALPAAALGGLRTLVINLTAALCGSRFGRGWIVPGGVRFDVDDQWLGKAKEVLGTVREKFADVKALLFGAASALARFEDTGIVSVEAARQIGMVGMAARASGVDRDVRIDFPYGIFRYASIGSVMLESGDAYARAEIRALEISHSIDFILEQIENLPPAKQKGAAGGVSKEALVVSMTEGHRGEIAHVLLTGANGELSAVKIKDPSFHNWQGLAVAVRENGISDFPLCNKSFDLSYSGHDL
ncbi:MAG: NADH-quinone oxidoreductase subunit C [Chthoniobacteraceae bacterium]|nr:NADH-quinone oxidoreductase subunit C [Chthoniobacteraceae bacterium]